MKQEIEKEAKEFADSDFVNYNFKEKPFTVTCEAFISGVNSKSAERIKINYTIGILHELLEEIPVGSKGSKIISNKFQQLQNQLTDGK